ncbi:MAG TPA: beta-ketoacyl-[acyl-carrier-protein] synthase family protein [Tepidisphaeraceae bacterium]|nr:beta-ketoacyl-[acyl-carrier-protein] synthase family protein [Tepidisphaeraceae bacterium]
MPRSNQYVTRSSDQIVITGVGLVTPLGLSLDETWRAVSAGRCGMGPMSAMESPLPAGADGGQAPDLPTEFAPTLPRESRYLRFAILQALRDAGLEADRPCDADRCGIALGTTLHGMRAGGEFFRSGDPAVLKDFLAGSVLRNVASDLGFAGCALTTCSACSSSLGSIALALTLLRSGQLDLVVAGGYDTISEYVYGGFNSLRLVSPDALRPFARERKGMKLAEGYGIVVLERLPDAAARGARPFAEVLGYGESADAHHLTQPHPQGEGAGRAMRQAIESAGLSPADISLVAAHATGTPDNDASEFAAMSRVFGDALAKTPVVAFKSHLGHTLGGAGAVELILSAMALREQIIPACANVRADEIEFDRLNLCTGASRPAALRTALNTSLGFGGANTCVILRNGPAIPLSRYSGRRQGEGLSREHPFSNQDGSSVNPRPNPLPEYRAGGKSFGRDVFITGIGSVFPGLIGNEAFVRRLQSGADPVRADTGPVADSEISHLLNARRVRRMSEYVKLSLAATVLCLQDAGISDVPAFAETCGAILGTAHGSTNYCEQYYGQIVREGVAAANPMLFAEGVPNAAAAHLSLMLSLKGPCQTVIGSRTAGLDAIRLAAARIASGEWDRAIVGAADEYSAAINAAYARFGLHGPGGFVSGAGAVSLVLESRASLDSRGGKPRGRIVAAAGGLAPGARIARLARSILHQLGPFDRVVGSANGTWIDRIEGAGAGREMRSPYGSIAESFSATPLAGLAGALLLSPKEHEHRVGVIAADYSGAVSGVAMEIVDP